MQESIFSEAPCQMYLVTLQLFVSARARMRKCVIFAKAETHTFLPQCPSGTLDVSSNFFNETLPPSLFKVESLGKIQLLD
jgi:hypothetical protein